MGLQIDKLSTRNLVALISFIVAKLLSIVCAGLIFVAPAAFWPTLIVTAFFLLFSMGICIWEYLSQAPERKRALYHKLKKEFENEVSSTLH